MKRKLPKELRDLARKKLDEALDMYERGDPLWIHTECGWSGTKATGIEDAEVSITIKETW